MLVYLGVFPLPDLELQCLKLTGILSALFLTPASVSCLLLLLLLIYSLILQP